MKLSSVLPEPRVSLVVDLADYFQSPYMRPWISPADWPRLAPRLETATDRVLQLLEQTDSGATFVADNWTLRHAPAAVQRVLAAGYELAFSEEALSAECDPLVVQENDIQLEFSRKEQVVRTIPHAVRKSLLGRHPIATGLAIRSDAPAQLARHWRRWLSQSQPLAVRVAAWEFDSDQPKLSVLPRKAHYKQYHNLDSMYERCRSLLRDFPATAVTGNVGKTSDPLFTFPLSQPLVAAPDSIAERVPVTIVVPCYNEEDTLPSLARTVRSVTAALSSHYDVFWLFVDDGSIDDTARLLGECLSGPVRGRLIGHPKNRGISAAIRTGIEQASTELVASIDADGSYDPCELVHMFPLMADDVALVTASPYHPAGAVRNVPAWRLALSWGASQAYRSVLRSRLYTFTSCFRVYRKSRVAALPLSEDRFLGTAELVAELLRRGERVVEHPATLSVRLFGCSKLKTTRTIIDHLRLLARLSLAGKHQPDDPQQVAASVSQ